MSKLENIWTTRDGKKINIKDMTTEQIKNTIKSIKDGTIQFTRVLRWTEDNNYQIIGEDIYRKGNWLIAFEQELEDRDLQDNTEEIEELPELADCEERNMKINELVKAVNQMRKENSNG